MNSAIGSKVLSFRTIMIISSIGIFIGAVYSSGMMEVARKGIFNPGEFYFDEIMVIFLAVIMTDILLLDFFNTLGLPTSTTVSIVFNLLGAAIVMSLIKIAENNESVSDLVNYINTEKATMIIGGILLSVLIAFSIGVIVQWISRLIFSFQYEKKLKSFGYQIIGPEIKYKSAQDRRTKGGSREISAKIKTTMSIEKNGTLLFMSISLKL